MPALLNDFFEAEEPNDITIIQKLRDALEKWEKICLETNFDEVLPLSVVREQWLGSIDDPQLSQRFFDGSIIFSTLMPMRSIPFRVICLLGMNDDVYPRKKMTPDFDLMAMPTQQRYGDRSRRDDDRHLFLEALLAARDTFYISWGGPAVFVITANDHPRYWSASYVIT